MAEGTLADTIRSLADAIVAHLQGNSVEVIEERFAAEAAEKILSDLPEAERHRIRIEPGRNAGRIFRLVEDRMLEADFRRNVLSRLGLLAKPGQAHPRVFCSYRRSEFPDFVQHVAARLQRSGLKVFFDKSSLREGRFPEQLGAAVRSCDVFVLFYGTMTFNRMTDREDWVRREIETALSCGKLIIPLAVDGTPMPEEHHLPQSIRAMCRFNAQIFFRDRFDDDIQNLCSWIKGTARRRK